MFGRILAGPVLAVAVLACVAPAARADFTLVSQDLDLSRKDDAVRFTLTFNQAPDFTTVDAQGRPANSFQVEFDGAVDPSTQLPTDMTAIVRGDEIHVANGVRVRTPTGGDWSANIFSLNYGDLTAQQTVTSIPAPPAFWAGLAGLTVVAGLSVRRTMARRRSGYFVG